MQGWHDGQLDDVEQLEIPVLDRGVQYGEGLYETILVRDGQLPLLSFHLDRLEASCGRLDLPFPGRSVVEDALRQTLDANDELTADESTSRGILKLVMTGGPGEGVHRAERMDPSLFVLPRSYSGLDEQVMKQGVTCRFVPAQGHSGTSLARVKSLSYLGEALAMESVRDRSNPNWFREALFVTERGRLLQGARTNVFLKRNGCWYTPPETDGILPGVGRELLLQSAGNTKVECKSLFGTDVQKARHMVLTNAVMGPVPVGELIAPSLLYTKRAPKTLDRPDPDNVLARAWRNTVEP